VGGKELRLCWMLGSFLCLENWFGCRWDKRDEKNGGGKWGPQAVCEQTLFCFEFSFGFVILCIVG